MVRSPCLDLFGVCGRSGVLADFACFLGAPSVLGVFGLFFNVFVLNMRTCYRWVGQWHFVPLGLVGSEDQIPKCRRERMHVFIVFWGMA